MFNINQAFSTILSIEYKIIEKINDLDKNKVNYSDLYVLSSSINDYAIDLTEIASSLLLIQGNTITEDGSVVDGYSNMYATMSWVDNKFLTASTFSLVSSQFIKPGYGRIDWHQISGNVPNFLLEESDPVFKANSGIFWTKNDSLDYNYNLKNQPDLTKYLLSSTYATQSGDFLTQNSLSSYATTGYVDTIFSNINLNLDFSNYLSLETYSSQSGQFIRAGYGRIDYSQLTGTITNDIKNEIRNATDSIFRTQTGNFWKKDEKLDYYNNLIRQPDLTNYLLSSTYALQSTSFLKSDALDNYWTKAEISQAIANLNNLKIILLDSLPDLVNGGVPPQYEDNTIYLVPQSEKNYDIYNEYLIINRKWELIGNTRVDLSDYANLTTKNTFTQSITVTNTYNDQKTLIEHEKITIYGEGGEISIFNNENDGAFIRNHSITFLNEGGDGGASMLSNNELYINPSNSNAYEITLNAFNGLNIANKILINPISGNIFVRNSFKIAASAGSSETNIFINETSFSIESWGDGGSNYHTLSFHNGDLKLDGKVPNSPGGFVILNNNGQIPLSAIPTNITIAASQIEGLSIGWDDLTTKPPIPTKVSQLTNDSGFITSVSWDDLTTKPSLFSGNYNDLSNKPELTKYESSSIVTFKNNTYYKCSDPITNINVNITSNILNSTCIFTTGNSISYSFDIETGMKINKDIILETNKTYIFTVDNGMIIWNEIKTANTRYSNI